MSAPKKRNIKNIVENSLEISHIVLTTLNDAARLAPVPYLQQAAGLALGILKMVQAAKDNKDAFQKLAADTCELVYMVLCMYEEATKKGDGSHGPSRKLVGDLQGLLNTISSIERFSRKEVSRGALVRFFTNKTDLGRIQDYRDTLRRSLDLFGSDVAIREATSQLIGQHEKILRELQRDREEKDTATSVAALVHGRNLPTNYRLLRQRFQGNIIRPRFSAQNHYFPSAFPQAFNVLMPAQATFKSIKVLVPLLDNVLVQRLKPEIKTATGTFLPTFAMSNPLLSEATVVSVGPGVPNKDGQIVPTQVKVGDHVVLPGWGGNAIKVGEEEYFLLKESEILAKINK